jgi:hypothetical protein
MPPAIGPDAASPWVIRDGAARLPGAPQFRQDQGHERMSGPLITTKLQLMTFLSIGCVSMAVLIMIE